MVVVLHFCNWISLVLKFLASDVVSAASSLRLAGASVLFFVKQPLSFLFKACLKNAPFVSDFLDSASSAKGRLDVVLRERTKTAIVLPMSQSDALKNQ